jgi:hypothetical protein
MTTTTTTTTDRRPPPCSELRHLDAWLDDELSDEARAAFATHAESCLPCRKAVDDSMRIRSWARALAPEVTPDRDLWAGVEAVICSSNGALSPPTAIDRPAAPSVRKVPWTWAAAAAILLSVGTSMATAAWMGTADRASGSTGIAAQAHPGGLGGDLVAVAAWEDDVRTATADLAEALDARRDELDPETLAVVERNLAIIDQAITETRAALSLDPGDDRARGALVAAYNQKIRVLQRTLRLPAT